VAGAGAVGVGRGISSLADRCRHRRGRARRRARRQVTTGPDDDRPRRPRRMVSSTSRAPRPTVEVGSRAGARPRTPGRSHAPRARLRRGAARRRSLAGTLQDARSRDRREWRTPRGSPEDDPRRLARRDLVRPLPGRAIRLRQPIGRPLDQPPGQEGRADRFGLHGSRANDRRADRRPPPAAPDDEATATDETNASEEPVRTPGDQAQTAPVRAPAPEQATPPELPPAPEPETAEAAAERERRCRELFGMDEPKPRRRWRR
jgi:hypothetical protein